MILRFIFTVSLMIIISSLYSQVEICNNGIDDDMDGLIDCFDDDCCMVESCIDFWYNPCLDDDCIIEGPENFEMETKVIAPSIRFLSYINFVVGDLDQDGNNEIVIHTEDEKLQILDATTQEIKHTLTQGVGDLSPQLLIADAVLTSPGAEVIYFSGDTLFAFSAAGLALWNNSSFEPAYHLSAADFNQDGTAEIYSSNRIMNGATGDEILFIPDALSTSNSRGTSMAIDILPDSACPTCDGLELVSDSKVYAIDIASATFTLQRDNSDAMPGRSLSVCADWDNDGVIDVLSMSDTRITVWSPLTDVELHSTTINSGLKGLPNINDIDGDGLPELVFINDDDLGSVIAMDNNLEVLWIHSNSVREKSGSTAVTTFDFDADGILEIVYRDEKNLGVLNAQNGNVIEVVDCTAVTQGENPIVVDYNQDDEAEILVVCGITLFDSEGLLTEFSSGGSTTWADCRPIWNQESYHNIHIKDDLTVPAVQQLQHLPTVGSTLNSFLNQYQIPRTIETNLSLNSISALDCETIQIEICNTGLASVDESVAYTIYYGDPTVSDVTTVTGTVNVNIVKDDCTTFNISSDEDYMGQIFIIINDAGTSSLPLIINDALPNTTLEECEYDDNILSIDAVECEEPECTDLAVLLLNPPSCGLVSIEICNNGGTTIDTVLQIVAYNSEDNVPVSQFNSWEENINMLPDDCVVFNYTIPAATVGDFIFNINDNGLGAIPFDIDTDPSLRSIFECDYSNNYESISLANEEILFDLGDDIFICPDDSTLILGPSGSFIYQWSNGETSQNITVSAADTYTLNITDDCGSTASDELIVSVGSDSYTQLDIELCSGDSLIIDDEWLTPTTSTLEIELTNTLGCDSIVEYFFTYNEKTTSELTVTKCPGEPYTYLETGEVFSIAGSYEITLTNAAGCDSILTLNIDETPQDSAVVTVTAPCPDEENGSIIIDFEDADVSDYSYTWTDDVSLTNEATSIAEGTYIITVTDPNGCPIILMEDVKSSTVDLLVEEHSDVICEDGTGTIKLNPELNREGFSVNMNIIEEFDIQNLDTGTYNITFMDDNACLFTDTVTIVLSTEIDAALPDTVYAESLLDVTIGPVVSSESDYTYIWSDNDYISCLSCQDLVFNSASDQMLELLIIDQDGCTKSISTFVKVENVETKDVYLPNVFNPSSINPINSQFKVQSTEGMSSLRLSVYDRWGNKVFTSTDPLQTAPWDGRLEGSRLSSGVYVYLLEVEFEDGTYISRTGSVTLIW